MRWLGLTLLFIFILGVACDGSGDALEANAGEDFTVRVGEQPQFDGCESAGEIANYKWTIVSAPGEMHEDAGKVIRELEAACVFTLDAQMGVDEVGLWEIELEVTDGDGNIDTDTVQVTVTE